MDSWVMIAKGRISAARSSIIFLPASRASWMRRPSTAGMVPLPISPMPKASVKQFMVLAVNIPAQLPQPGQAISSSPSSSSWLISPLTTLPTAMYTVLKSARLPSPKRPASMGPPLMKMEGMLSLTAAKSIPGTILSQLAINTKPSKPCA